MSVSVCLSVYRYSGALICQRVCLLCFHLMRLGVVHLWGFVCLCFREVTLRCPMKKSLVETLA